MGSVAQAMAGPEVDDAIAKQLDMISNNPASATADEGIENLKDVHSKIKRYLGKLNQLYATPPVPNGETPSNAPEQSGKRVVSFHCVLVCDPRRKGVHIS